MAGGLWCTVIQLAQKSDFKCIFSFALSIQHGASSFAKDGIQPQPHSRNLSECHDIQDQLLSTQPTIASSPT